MNLEVDQISDEIDEMEKVLFYRDLVKRNIGYDDIMSRPNWPDRELFAELFEVICDVVCVKRKTIKVNGANCPYELVKSKFLKLNNTHLQYVINCMQKTNKKIKNIRGYMITALYNAPDTIDHFYQQIY